MKIFFLIQSYIPAKKNDAYLPILKETIKSIRSQNCDKTWDVNIILSDDGSDYLRNYYNEKINILDSYEVKEINKTYNLNVDKIILKNENKDYSKAELFNYYLKKNRKKYDFCVFLDDDHAFIRSDSLSKFAEHFKNGYNFIAGRLCNPGGEFRSAYDKSVQGTTFALSYKLLEEINYWSERVIIWGCGEDSEISYKVYSKCTEGKVKAIYDGNIITVDKLSGRWAHCAKKAGGIEFFIKDFKNIYGVHPHKNNSRDKSKWMDIAPNDKGISEKLFMHIKIEEYLSYNKKKYYMILWYLKFFLNFFRRGFLFLKRKLSLSKEDID